MIGPTNVDVAATVQALCRTELGAALWRAAQWEALAEAQHERIAELERQKAPGVQAAEPPAEPAAEERTDG